MAINVGSGSETVEFTESIEGLNYARLLFESPEEIAIVGNDFTDTFAGYEVHVYELHAPEPATMVLLIVGGVALIRRKRK